ncbi:hypothetical protein HOY80DRAFT_1052463 [Tuber brumale]|nr:hypothetical protein HOY80DRAFT_1052463 [Tuber brumale]
MTLTNCLSASKMSQRKQSIPLKFQTIPWKNAPVSSYTLLPKAYTLAYRPTMPYKFHPYSVLAKRGHKTEPGKLLFAELTALYAEHKEHIKPMEPTWYACIK